MKPHPESHPTQTRMAAFVHGSEKSFELLSRISEFKIDFLESDELITVDIERIHETSEKIASSMEWVGHALGPIKPAFATIILVIDLLKSFWAKQQQDREHHRIKSVFGAILLVLSIVGLAVSLSGPGLFIMAAVGSFISVSKAFTTHQHLSQQIKKTRAQLDQAIHEVQLLSEPGSADDVEHQKKLKAQLKKVLALSKKLDHLKEHRTNERIAIALGSINTIAGIISIFFPLIGLLGYACTMSVGTLGFLGSLAKSGIQRAYRAIRYRLNPEARQQDQVLQCQKDLEHALGKSLLHKTAHFLKKASEKTKTALLASALVTSFNVSTIPENTSLKMSTVSTETSQMQSAEAQIPVKNGNIKKTDGRTESSVDEEAKDDTSSKPMNPAPEEEPSAGSSTVFYEGTRRRMTLRSKQSISIDVQMTGRPLQKEPLPIIFTPLTQNAHAPPLRIRSATLFADAAARTQDFPAVSQELKL